MLDRLIKEFILLTIHVKMDVEGSELGVISVVVKLLSPDNAPLLFIELHNEIVRQNGGSPTEMLRLLRTLSYEIFATNGDLIDDQEILNRPLIRIVAKRNSRL